ncbi:MAG: PHP domain-containing protein [Gemmataceae bacterium]
MNPTFRHTRLAVCLLLTTLLGCGRPAPQDVAAPVEPRFLTKVEWAEKGVWLKTDTHLHTKFSDGSYTPLEVARKAASFGCDAIAITDHADKNLKAASPEYHEAIEAARRGLPKLIVLTGMEWNVPPWGGDEHATVLISPAADERKVMAVFKSQFDDLGRKEHKAELTVEALRWLEANATAKGVKPVVIYNHPSRKDADAMENVADVVAWRKVNDLVVGFDGAPGHQGYAPLGAYKYKVKPLDRWDPAVADVGGAWDAVLRKGIDFWGARADSDFHNDNARDLNDFWPGQFSETWLYAPDRSADGVLRAYRAGSFFGVHGHIARQVELTVEAEGLPRRAYPGEVIAVPAGTSVKVRLSCAVPAKDWRGEPNRLDDVDLIVIDAKSASVVATKPVPADGVVTFDPITVPEGGLVLRARGRRVMPAAPHLRFYTNPIRIRTEV